MTIPNESINRRVDITAIENAYEDACKRRSDINEHLPTLRQYASKCKRVTEFGTRHGVSTIAFLAANPERLHAYDLRYSEEIAGVAAMARNAGIDFRFFQGDVLATDIEETELLLIDTYHEYNQLIRELSRHADKVTSFIVLHDTMTFGLRSECGQPNGGLLAAMYEFLHGNREWRLRELFPNNNGLAVLERVSTDMQEPRNGAINGPMGRFGIVKKGNVTPIRHLLPQSKDRFPTPPKLGLVIGTFASVPFVHLQLEARRRFYPNVPVLVHDDASHSCRELRTLCEEYGAEFESTERRFTHEKGDLTVFFGGLSWAHERGIDLLVKLSRRFVPVMDWTSDLCKLAIESQHATYSTWCQATGFGFRTECIGMAVESWITAGALPRILDVLETNRGCPLVEAFIHDIARSAAVIHCDKMQEFERRFGSRPSQISGYAVWPFMGFNRERKYPHFLIHQSTHPSQYHQQAMEWGLPYEASAFENTKRINDAL